LEIEPKPEICFVEIPWKLPDNDDEKLVTSNSTERSKMSIEFNLEKYSYGKECSAKMTLNSQRREGTIYFFVHQDPENQNYSVEEVSCALVNENDIQRVKMTPQISEGLNFTRIFSRRMTSVLGFPSKITFYVKLFSTVPSFTYTFADKWFGYNLWKVAEEKSLTDIELLVGNSSFSAHRALLSARSPVFAAMLKSGMEEARTGRVLISDVDDETFTHFLRFMYEGEKGSWDRSMKEKLFALADRYEVETLMDLCRPSRSVDVEEMMDAFFSC